MSKADSKAISKYCRNQIYPLVVIPGIMIAISFEGGITFPQTITVMLHCGTRKRELKCLYTMISIWDLLCYAYKHTLNDGSSPSIHIQDSK